MAIQTKIFFIISCALAWGVLLRGLTLGQSSGASSPPQTNVTTESLAAGDVDRFIPSSVGPEDPVITLNDFCLVPPASGTACKTVITRAQFEKMTTALQPGMPLSLQLKVANSYARNLKMAAAAENRGLDKTLAFEEEMYLARLQLLAQDLSRVLKEDADKISDAEIADYYDKNHSAFEQATVARIFVPHEAKIASSDNLKSGARPTIPEATEARQSAAERTMITFAADLRTRAISGEDLEKLQREAYAMAGIERKEVNTRMEKVRRSALPPLHESIMDLKPGEVSEVLSDPGGAHFIYKMISKETLPLKEARDEIRSTISSRRLRDSMKQFQENIVLSDAYFNPPSKSSSESKRNHKENLSPSSPSPN
jgi:hypothetical protein